MTLLFALTGAIVLGLLIYVVIRCRVNKQRHAQTILPKQQYQIIQQVPHYSYMYKQHHSAYPIVYLQHSGHTGRTVYLIFTVFYPLLWAPAYACLVPCLSKCVKWLQVLHNALRHPLILMLDLFSVVTTTTKYRDVPAPIRKSISRSLANDGSWLSLAHHLGNLHPTSIF